LLSGSGHPPRHRALFGDAEAGDHFAQFLAGGDVAEADISELLQVEKSKAGGEELAIDDALAKTRNNAKSDAAGELVERIADAAHILRLDMLEAVAE
jgi:hypothetical protein